MKRLLLLVLFASITGVLQSQVVFYEDFNGIVGPTAGGAGTYVFPAGWLLRNVDNRVPDAQVAYVNEAWERREDFGLNVGDSCAFSTSYYSPAGAADDWMWTPLIGPLPANAVLSWRARTMDPSYPDGYEVRIMTVASGPPTGGTGVLGNQVANSTQIFSIAAETTSWTTRTFTLSGYTGQSVYIAFRNTSNDKFILLIDDVKVEVIHDYDASVTAANNYEYSLAPKSQATVPMGGTITNMGQLSLTNVSLAAEVYNSSNVMVQGSVAISIPTLASGATHDFSLGNYVPSAPGTYTIKYFPSTSQSDQRTVNDTMTRTVLITDSVFARDDGIVTGQLGIAAGNGYIGQSFTITTAAELRTVTASYTRGYTGKQYAFAIWNTTAGDVPNTMIASTDTLLYADDNAFTDTIPIHGGYVTLAPGKYVITGIEFDSTLHLAQTATVFTTGTMWVKWDANPTWTNLESFGSQFRKPLVIRANITINNSTPVITSNGGGAAAGVSMGEGSTAVTTVTATDADAASTVYYVLNGGADADKFIVNSSTGALAFATAPDFENPADADANNTYIVIVRATDGAKTDDQTITVTITNVNEPPVITSNGGGANASISLAENTAAATTVIATDADAGAAITFSINGGADAVKFGINSSTGALNFNSAPDFENPTDADANNTYIVIVRASDGTLNADQTITVTVTDINDNAPIITSNGGGANAATTIAENTTMVTTVSATDADAGSSVNYSISGGADAAKFGINNITGTLAFTAAPDFESPADADANNTYIVTVRASDGTLNTDQVITITVSNANDNTPVITSNGGGANAGVSIAENNTATTTVTATDADAGTTITYSLNGGTDAAKFTVNSSTGVLAFITAPDFETATDADANNTYIVIVRVSDGTFTDEQTITVTVNNVNDNSPVITSDGGGTSANLSVLNPQQQVTTVAATDADGSLNTLTYSITGGADAGDFTINPSTGQLSFINPTDYNNPQDADLNNVYLVTVQVSDGTFTDNQSVSVTVTGLLPVTLTRLVGLAATNSNILEWSTVNETGIEGYDIEKSSNGYEFAKTGSLVAKPGTANEYLFADMQYQPVNFYRLKMKNRDGGFTYSRIIKLERHGGNVSVKVYPNPVKNGSVSLQLKNLAEDRYHMELYDAAGRLLIRQSIQHQGGTATVLIKLGAHITGGVYLLRLRGSSIELAESIMVE